MALNFEDKKRLVEKFSLALKPASILIAVKYEGLTVSATNAIRKNAREKAVTVKVLRNTLARLAVKETPYHFVADDLVGSLMLVFSNEEPGAVAKILRTALKEHDKLSVHLIALDGQLLSANHLEAIASLPTKEEAIAQLMAVLQAPVSNFVRTMAAPTGQFVRTLAAYRDKKQAEA